jgi:hypothetical protein
MNEDRTNQQKQGQVADRGNKQRETQDDRRKEDGKGLEGGRLNQSISQSGSDRSNQQVQSGSNRHAQKPMPAGVKEGDVAGTGGDIEDENKKVA